MSSDPGEYPPAATGPGGYGGHDTGDDPYLGDEDYPADPSDPPADGAAETVFTTVLEFVEQHLSQVYARDLTDPGVYWCPRWWAHPEALDRLEACWRAWEHHRKDKTTGPSTWWREDADPAMRALLSPTGPFSACGKGHQTRRPVRPLPTEPADPRLFPPRH